MKYRKFGNTDMFISEYSFGAWGIGGQSYGPVEETDAMKTLSVSEELGCNFIDTASVYGNSETIIGNFLKDRRHKWLLATKYSGQHEGLESTLERQLKTLQTDHIDFYQIHWAPAYGNTLYNELENIKSKGKARYIGVSLYNIYDLDLIIKNPAIDGFQIAFNLLEPLPYLSALQDIRQQNKGVIVRSSLKSGLLTDKYTSATKFTSKNDHRSELTSDELETIFDQIQKFLFLKEKNESLLHAAARYPLDYEETTTVLLGTKSSEQAYINYHEIPSKILNKEDLNNIKLIQRDLGLLKEKHTLKRYIKKLLLHIKKSIKI